jgi:hypothetical protein
LGLVVDALCTLNPDNLEDIKDIEGLSEGLSVGAGFDYSFLDGNFYVLAEYLYNGFSSVTAAGFGGSWTNNHYLYGTVLFRFNDYCSLSLATVFCFDDLSFSPFATLNYDFFHGFSLNLAARYPLDQNILSDGKPGELGPIPPKPDGSPGAGGARFIINAGLRLRF